MIEMLNSLIRAVSDAGLSQILFYGFHGLSMLTGYIVSIYYCKKMGVHAIKAIILLTVGFSLSYVFMLVFYWVQTGFQSFGGQNNATVFIYYPLFYWIPAKLMKIDLKVELTVLTVGAPLVQAIGHIGCIFPGCCEGYPAPWGIYNIRYNETLFPNQLLEAIIAAAIAIFFIWKIKRNEFVPDIKHYPTMLIMYGSTRFVLEFFRHNRKILFGCSPVAFHALFMCIVGIVALIVIKKKRETNSILKELQPT